MLRVAIKIRMRWEHHSFSNHAQAKCFAQTCLNGIACSLLYDNLNYMRKFLDSLSTFERVNGFMITNGENN